MCIHILDNVKEMEVMAKKELNLFGFVFAVIFFVVWVLIILSISYMFNETQVSILWLLAFVFTAFIMYVSHR